MDPDESSLYESPDDSVNEYATLPPPPRQTFRTHSIIPPPPVP